jgi:hypothetical protein
MNDAGVVTSLRPRSRERPGERQASMWGEQCRRGGVGARLSHTRSSEVIAGEKRLTVQEYDDTGTDLTKVTSSRP